MVSYFTIVWGFIVLWAYLYVSNLNKRREKKTLESPFDCKEIKPVNLKRNQPWVFIGRTDAGRSNTLATWCEELTYWKRPWCWEDWKQKEKGVTEDEMVGWHHQLTGHNFERSVQSKDKHSHKDEVGDSGGQKSLVCYSPWGCKELDVTEQLNNNVNNVLSYDMVIYIYTMLYEIIRFKC